MILLSLLALVFFLHFLGYIRILEDNAGCWGAHGTMIYLMVRWGECLEATSRGRDLFKLIYLYVLYHTLSLQLLLFVELIRKGRFDGCTETGTRSKFIRSRHTLDDLNINRNRLLHEVNYRIFREFLNGMHLAILIRPYELSRNDI